MRRAPQTEGEIEAARKELMEIWEKIKAKTNYPQSFDPKVPDMNVIRKLTNAQSNNSDTPRTSRVLNRQASLHQSDLR